MYSYNYITNFLNKTIVIDSMCGIIGVFNHENAENIVKHGLDVMKNRGLDNSDSVSFDGNIFTDDKNKEIKTKISIGHNLHAIVDLVHQPIKFQGKYLVANCEIYNWKELNSKYSLDAKNDAELILKLIIHNGVEKIASTIEEFDGVFAFCYYDPEIKKCIVARDLLGVKPMWFCFSNFFAFSSEKKALLKNDIYDVIELNPRKIVSYDIEANKLEYINRDFFEICPEWNEGLDEIKKETFALIEDAIKKRITEKKVGILFSGGIDSVFIAYMLKKYGVEFICYTAAIEEKGMEKAEDLIYAEKFAKMYNVPLKVTKVTIKEAEKYIKKIIPLIESTNVVKVGVALPFFIACEEAHKDGVKVIFSGLGSEEIFAGYERHEKSDNVNKECVSGLLKMYERDLYRDDVITMANSIELRLPFLDRKLVEYALKIPAEFKMADDMKKVVLRKIADGIGIDKQFTWRKKKAAQYGSKFDRGIEKLTKKNGFKYKADYLNSLSDEWNLNLGIMWSSGKDCSYAGYLMEKHNYKIKCLLTMKSKNKYSYMFHTPNVNIAQTQADAMEIPIIFEETDGEKEHEIEDMKKLLTRAKNEFGIDGIVTGAIFSTYQRTRIEKAADEIGFKIFSPLWHKNQEEEMRELIDAGFKIMFSSVAADGLDDSWLDKIIDHSDIDKLVKLNDKIGLNVAGEGGEFESLVVDSPMFKKNMIIKKSHIEKEDSLNYFYVIDEVDLVDKE